MVQPGSKRLVTEATLDGLAASLIGSTGTSTRSVLDQRYLTTASTSNFTVADNGDGTFVLAGSSVADNGNGTYTLTY